MRTVVIALLAGLAAACSAASSTAGPTNAATAAIADATVAPGAGRPSPPQPVAFTAASKPCGDQPIDRTTCMIELILDDLRTTGDGVGGGGISAIDARGSTNFTVSLPMEERVQKYDYAFAVSPGRVAISGKWSWVVSYGR